MTNFRFSVQKSSNRVVNISLKFPKITGEKRIHYAHFLRDQGYSQKDIAERLGITERTVRNYFKTKPVIKKKRKTQSKLDPLKLFL